MLLSLIFCQHAIGQQSTVTVNIKDGKAIIQSPQPVYHSLPNDQPVSSKLLSVTSTITLAVTTTNATCNINNGSITCIPSGGTPPYSFALSNGWVLQTGNFPFVLPGNYTLTVTDALGETASANITINNSFLPPSWTSPTFQNASSCASSDASVAINATGGTPPYQYSMDGINWQTSNVFSNLYPGFYNVLIKDANGCTATCNIPFTLAGLLYPYWQCFMGMAFTFTEFTCGGNSGFISSSNGVVVGGPYTYSLDGINYQSTVYFTNLSVGTHLLHVKNSAGMVTIFAFNILRRCYIQIDYIGVDAACQQNNGTLTVSASQGTPPYTYTLDGVNFQSSNVFTGLAPGEYFVTVKDAGGYNSSELAIVYDRCPEITLSATAETCIQNDGTITATAIKGTPPYQYSIDGVNFQPGNVFTGLDAGAYTITVKDALGFTGTRTINVGYACVMVSGIPTSSTCGNSNGSITASASNGTAPYQYSLNGINFQSSNTFTGLAPGVYTVTAKDNTGKTGTTTITVSNIPGPQLTATTNPAFCPNNNGTITITGLGGTSPLQYSIDGTNFQSSTVFNNIGSGSYTAFVKDVNGCLASQAVTVAFNCPSIAVNHTNETCGNSNAVATITGGNGTVPYTYSIDGINFQASNVFNGIAAGTYTFTIKDALGAISSTSITIINVCPTVTATTTDGLCGIANASIIATGANGTAPYQYSIDGVNFQIGNGFTGLSSGTYTITVRDANGLTNTTTATVQNFTSPVITVIGSTASCLNNDGSISINSTGGQAPFQYSINGTNFQAGNVFNGIAGGNYTATIKDANGCLSSATVNIVVDTNLALSTGNSASVCEGKSVVLPATSNGTGFTWTPSTGLNNTNLLNPQASPSVTTKYYIVATLGVCTKRDSITVVINPAPVANAGNNSTVCFGQNIQLNGTGGVTYEWTPSTYLNDRYISNPTSITYQLKVKDGNGCESLQSSSVTVTVTPMPKVFAGNDTSIIMNQPFMLMAKDVNNSGFSQYTWTPSYGLSDDMIQQPVAVLDRDMTYIVTAKTSAGCTGIDEIKVKVYKGPEIYVPTAFSPNADGKNDILKAVPVGIKHFKYFVVFNRWGEKVFHTSNASVGWDGRFKQLQLETTAFVWVAEGLDDKGNIVQRKGTVTLVR